LVWSRGCQKTCDLMKSHVHTWYFVCSKCLDYHGFDHLIKWHVFTFLSKYFKMWIKMIFLSLVDDESWICDYKTPNYYLEVVIFHDTTREWIWIKNCKMKQLMAKTKMMGALIINPLKHDKDGQL
jgi:hypothetical protein